MNAAVFRVGARTSLLARRQAGFVVDGLAEEAAVETEFVGIRTVGDIAPDVPIGSIGVTGVFTRELERALLEGEIDAAVHSLKDLATRMPEGLRIGAVLPRESPLDALILSEELRARAEDDPSRSGLDALPDGAVVGTASLRRRAFLLRLRPDLRVETIRGNVPTRLDKLRSGSFDAIVLAAAGLRRLERADEVDALLPVTEFPPAPGQGAVAVQVRDDDERSVGLVARLDHPPSAIAVTAERSFLNRIEGGCQVPAGALAEIDGTTLALSTLVCSPDGRRAVAASAVGSIDDAAAVGLAAADQALQDGADEILAPLRAGATGEE
ncbi:MAG TPA: hydroxymethylbilane synthase [Gemmatimonadota bacterium]|nr:hydroxymethylbilane synthase [Gemmatimonadota bacterium]